MESKNPTAPAPDGVPVPVKADPDWHWEVTPVISLRDYFASHAPFPPPDWFSPVMDRKNPSWGSTGIPTSGEVIQKWYVDLACQKWIQWPYAWAELQLAAREASPQEENPE